MTPTQTDTQMMNIVIVGHVDHGKSTLIGRLLADTDSLPKGKLDQVRAMCERNAKPFEYAFLLDALKDEQDQGITIDMARCFFKTQKRHYIIIDAPGHIEFLKNMITGASRAEAAVLLIDAKEGVRENSRRHGYMLALLGIKQVVVVVNKMDLVDYDQAVYKQIVEEYTAFLKEINLTPKTFVPISAFEGDNLVQVSDKTPWYTGQPVLPLIDDFIAEKPATDQPLRFPLQGVYKFTESNDDRRIFAGTIAQGKARVGDKVVFLPSGKSSTIKAIEGFNMQPQQEVGVGQATGFTLAEQIYVKPGELMVNQAELQPKVSTRLRANLFWLGKTPMVKNKRYKIKLLASRASVYLETVEGVLDASDLSKDTATQEIARHEVAEVVLQSLKPIAFDETHVSASCSRFVIIDDYEIAGGGIITEALAPADTRSKKAQLDWDQSQLSPQDRAARLGQNPLFIAITGAENLPLTDWAKALEKSLFGLGKHVYYLGIPADLKERDARLLKLAENAEILTDAGYVFISSVVDLDESERQVIEAPFDKGRVLVIAIGETALVSQENFFQLPQHLSISEGVAQIKVYLSEIGIFPEYSI